jgi:hypothetical protein
VPGDVERIPNMRQGIVTIGEYLARTDIHRKGHPLTQMLLRGQVKEESLPVLPFSYAIVKPLMRPVMPSLIATTRLMGVDMADQNKDTVVTGKKVGQILYLDEVTK